MNDQLQLGMIKFNMVVKVDPVPCFVALTHITYVEASRRLWTLSSANQRASEALVNPCFLRTVSLAV